MSMLSAQDAIDLLRANPSAYTTPAALRSLVVQLNTDASGGKTVLQQRYACTQLDLKLETQHRNRHLQSKFFGEQK